MQALILAAGMGRRMGKYTEKCTKCMVTVAGKTLIERAVEALKLAGIKKLIMVVGYECDKLVEFMNAKIQGIEIVFVYNHDYATTNNIYSLYLARDFLVRDDTVLLESDLIFDYSIIKGIVEDEHPNLAAVEKYAHWMDGTVVTIDEENNIIEFLDKRDFKFDNADIYYKTVNIYKFSKEFSKVQYMPFLEAYVKAYGVNQYYELVLKTLAHIENSELRAYILNNVDWYEIDDAQDLDIANTIFANDRDLLEAYEYRFGGYWRFPNIRDYCYLVNPYYPPQKMVDQMKYFFDTLLREYPSGMSIQKLNAERFFEVDEDYLLVGNGAAELINALGMIMSGTITLHMPTFNEYVRCFPNCKIIEINSIHSNFCMNKKEILSAVDYTDAIVIINPDNPSGSFILEKDIYEILDKCLKKNVTCIIDESFIDFADKDIRYTLLDNGILKKYINLIVLKSISKSYGVPGLRLGMLATANTELLKQIREKLAIWNINSFAEYFLQIHGLYKKEYKKACNKISEQRKYLQNELKKKKYLEVFPSQANYIMCRVKDKFTSKELASILIKQSNLLIKNLSTKNGFEGGEYIRIAIKNQEENEILLKALDKLEKRM